MALRENYQDSGPQFRDAEVPFLQMLEINASLQDGGAFVISTYQDDDEFGLSPQAQAKDRCDSTTWDGIFRRVQLAELPTGVVEHVSVFVDAGVLAEVELRIGGLRPLLLIAGEAEETPSGSLHIIRRDESVLVFTDPDDALRVAWMPPREQLTLVRELSLQNPRPP